MTFKAIAARSGVPERRVRDVYLAAKHAGFSDPMAVTASKFAENPQPHRARFGYLKEYEPVLLNSLIGAHEAMKLQSMPPGVLFKSDNYSALPIVKELFGNLNLPESHNRVFKNVVRSAPWKKVRCKSAYDEAIVLFTTFFDKYEITLERMTVNAALETIRQSVLMEDVVSFLYDVVPGSQFGAQNARFNSWELTGENSIWSISGQVECRVGIVAPFAGSFNEDPFRLNYERLPDLDYRGYRFPDSHVYQVNFGTACPVYDPDCRGVDRTKRQFTSKVIPLLLNIFGASA